MLDEGIKGGQIDESDEFARRWKGSVRSHAKDSG